MARAAMTIQLPTRESLGQARRLGEAVEEIRRQLSELDWDSELQRKAAERWVTSLGSATRSTSDSRRKAGSGL
jgi:hypothetical protein